MLEEIRKLRQSIRNEAVLTFDMMLVTHIGFKPGNEDVDIEYVEGTEPKIIITRHKEEIKVNDEK